MDIVRKYSPIIHTGFAADYTEQQAKAFVNRFDKMGYSGFSTEGKSEPRTNDIDTWLKGFLQGLSYAVKEASEKNMEVWLFDEWGYPTGTAAGKAMAGRPDRRSKKLHLAMDILLEKGQHVEFTVPSHFLAAAAWHVGKDSFGVPLSDDIVIKPKKGLLSYTATRKKERFCVVTWEYDCFRTVGVFVPDTEDDAQGTLDLLNKEAVAFFISQMHESYIPLLAKYFGNTIKGFFYDEPFVSFPTPYTFDILDEFIKSKGYDIQPRLPRVMAGLSGRDLLAYRDVCTTRVAEAFYGQMSKWCKDHGLEMVGHQDLDHNIRTLDSVSGHFFKNSAFNDAPGIDFIWSQIRPGYFTDFPRLAGSAARIAGKEHAISESFAATSSCLYPDYMRFCMEHQIIRGISRFFLMIADPAEAAKDDNSYTPSINPLMNMFTAKLNRRIGNTNMLAHTSRPSGRIVIYIPMDAVFFGLLNQKNPSSVSVAPYSPVWEYIDQAAKLLCYLPADFGYLWKEALKELQVDNRALITKYRQRIETVIVPPSAIEDEETCELLNKFIEVGGRVIFIGNPPKPLIGKGIVCPDVDMLKEYIIPDLKLSNPSMISVAHRTHCNGRTCYNVLTSDDANPYFNTGSCDECGVYYDDRLCNGNRSCVGMEIYFLLNEGEYPNETQIKFPYGGNILKYDFERESWVDIDQFPIYERFEPMQLIIYAVAGYPANQTQITADNLVCELTDWTVTLPDGKDIRIQILRDWREFYDKDYSGSMTYMSSFETEKAGLYRIDLGKVYYAARFWIDDKEYITAFTPFSVNAELSAGHHEIKIEVMNTSANKYFGTPKAELDNYDQSWFKTKVGTDRKYLTSGLLGPVRVYCQ